jgi:hypothetical protein
VTVPPSGDFVTWMSVSGSSGLGSTGGASTMKHSAVASVWVSGSYSVAGSGAYSARQQYVPAASAVSPTVKFPDCAVPPVSVIDTATGEPTWVPPDGQPAAVTSAGAQTKNVIVPGAGPSSPTSVALSWTEPPNATVDALAAVEISSVYASSAEAAGAPASPIDWSSSDSVKSVAQLNVRLRLVRVRRSTRTPRDAMCRPSPDRPSTGGDRCRPGWNQG